LRGPYLTRVRPSPKPACVPPFVSCSSAVVRTVTSGDIEAMSTVTISASMAMVASCCDA
jgi:hypothetical protein